MAADAACDVLVDGTGWISDDSDFYGSDELRDTLLARRSGGGGLIRRLEAARTPSPVKRPTMGPTETRNSGATPTNFKPPENMLGLLKFRPEVASMTSTSLRAPQTSNSKSVPSRHLSGRVVEDVEDYNHFEGHSGAWQHRETIDDFLKRLPVGDPDTQTFDGWVWVASAKIRRSHLKREGKTDTNAFVEGGFELLAVYDSKKAQLESDNPNKPPGTITRYLRPCREQLEDDLHALAVKTGTTSGKWMIFPKTDDLPRTWRLVAEATAEGRLGHTSKCTTYDPNDTKDERVICVYTYDFTDTADVRRVLNGLAELGLIVGPIYYKCDAYTYLGIKSKNPYKLRASMYSSQELLGGNARAKQEGPMGRATPASNGDAWEF
ncbi:DNA polymerase ii large subunit-like protein [Teratosphaeria destructans]|uniref:DNA polymerase ii large subunit-like protein n=1 Tax=Teratosphaeria destructans TaxID=418781 RepID=A0A9W7SYC2_9PEZI|nr:DNA polymerase ii large subunit-like protein [Teratosphaeria destructans]